MINVRTRKTVSLENYRHVIDSKIYEEIGKLADELKGIRICHVNATAYGGGVAEILRQEIPLLKSLGLDFTWAVINEGEEFFNVTKKIHNALQGGDQEFTEDEWRYYEYCNQNLASEFDPSLYDLVVVHDPQPAKMIAYLKKGKTKFVWRCHIDTTSPNEKVLNYFKKFIDLYDAYIFSAEQYVFKSLKKKIFIIPPAIDPLSKKNVKLDRAQAESKLRSFKINTKRPIVSQVSRFDPWKDPLGVVEAYKIAKKRIPNLRLVYAGNVADDDPEALRIYKQFEKAVENDKDIIVMYNQEGLEINALQTISDVVIQKSLREGFGLTVSEALWKGTPVIAGNVGGIPLQIEDGVNGYLVSSTQECAEKLIFLLENKEIAKGMGRLGREKVRQNFLLPRLIRDELAVIKEVLGSLIHAKIN